MKHPLDFSPPRISDLPPDAARLALLARADHKRESWLRTRQGRPLATRIMDLFRGAPPSPGRSDGGLYPRPAVAHSDADTMAGAR